MTHRTRLAFVLAALAVLPTVGITAQEPAWQTAPATTDDQEADRYLEQAIALEGDSLWIGAANLYERSAELRVNGDSRAQAAYDRAGTLLYLTARPDDARQMFVMAAVRALQGGHVFEAAQGYATAAELAVLGDACPRKGGDGLINVELALRLSDSPSLTDEQREEVRDRMDTYRSRPRR